jgi:hypothetical protein
MIYNGDPDEPRAYSRHDSVEFRKARMREIEGIIRAHPQGITVKQIRNHIGRFREDFVRKRCVALEKEGKVKRLDGPEPRLWVIA